MHVQPSFFQIFPYPWNAFVYSALGFAPLVLSCPQKGPHFPPWPKRSTFFTFGPPTVFFGVTSLREVVKALDRLSKRSFCPVLYIICKKWLSIFWIFTQLCLCIFLFLITNFICSMKQIDAWKVSLKSIRSNYHVQLQGKSITYYFRAIFDI